MARTAAMRNAQVAGDVCGRPRSAVATGRGIGAGVGRTGVGAATSAAANLEEAKAAYSRRDFAAKNSISLKEMRESRYWLRLISRCELAPTADVQPLLDEANELTAMLTAGMKRLNPTS